MISLLGALLGFMSSAFPEILKLWRTSKDQSHELAILDRQIEMAKTKHNYRLEEIQTLETISERASLYKHASVPNLPWVEGLSGTVRPIITYAFFALYALLKISQWHVIASSGPEIKWTEAFIEIWQAEDQVLFATVMSFWFGQRALIKKRGSF